MNPARKWIRDTFGFSGNEINGFLILIPLMVLAVFSQPLYHRWTATRERQYQEDRQKLDSLVAEWDDHERPGRESNAIHPVAFFSFDPNTATVAELRQLGFSDRSANRIAAYRQKGGVFRVKPDILKIYGLDSALYKRLYTFIKLPSGHLPETKRSGVPTRDSFGKTGVNKTFDINTADTILLKTVYGIGPVLAGRIVKFRKALGGFVNPEQLNEVYGLDSAVVQRLLKVCFIAPDFIPEKININTADEKRLSGHPYIRNSIAGALMSYRYQHGDFRDVNDIKKLSIMRADEAARLLPYIKVTD